MSCADEIFGRDRGARSEASTTWAAARMPAVSWIRPPAVAKTVRWSSQKVFGGLPMAAWGIAGRCAPMTYLPWGSSGARG